MISDGKQLPREMKASERLPDVRAAGLYRSSDSLMMKRLLWFGLTLAISIASLLADETVAAVQKRLEKAGFYRGKTTGIYDSETSAAVTRYQIRSGLPITGKLDAQTLKALGVPPGNIATAEPSPVSGTWRRLRNGDMQFLKKLNAGEIAPPKAPPAPSPRATVPAPIVAESAKRPMIDPHGPPPRLPEDLPNPTPASASQRSTREQGEAYDRERLRDYVGAFVLAGLDPKVGAELEFFADRVDYFGESNVPRERIRGDLLRYDKRWPDRRFWLGGEIEVGRASGGRLRVTFPLHYELRNGSRSASGLVRKALTLRQAVDGELEIVGVNETKKL